MQKTVLITGASRGIGAETARRFSAAGYAVALHYHRSEERALALAEELRGAGGEVLTVQADVGDWSQVRKMVDNVLDKFCQLDILICNAGVSWQGLLSEMPVEDWRRLCAVDLDGVFYCCKAVIPHFVARKAGKILTVSSMWGQTGGSCEAAYSAAKAGVIGLTKALAKELGPSGIAVNCVAPGVIATEMNQNLTPADLDALREETPLGRIGTAGDVAESLLFLASEGASFITGQVLAPNGGLVI
ncbi:MAG TPA: 3-oxoacyl-ACP reductase FabG [Candidatus Galloscillospira excrementavium]|nr:3-oxoacyl-ACP reductase FabG [Candidatus Galloscillospira excrementavium]